MLNIKEFDGKNDMEKFARKFPIDFHLTIFTENAFRLNPQSKRRALFFVPHVMFEFASYVFVHVGWLEIVKRDRFFELFCFPKTTLSSLKCSIHSYCSA